MAIIERRFRKNGIKFYAKIRLKGLPPEAATFDRLTDAKRWIQETETKMRTGRYLKSNLSKKYTLHDAIQRYFEVVLPLHKLKTQAEQRRHLERWDKELGDVLLINVTPDLISEVRDKLIIEITKGRDAKKGKVRSPATVNRYLGALSCLFTTARRQWRLVQDNPVFEIPKLEEPRGRVRSLTDEERELLLTACKKSANPFLYVIVVICIATGARKMEIVGLEKKEVDRKRQAIILDDTKNGDRRILFLGDYAWDLLMQHMEKYSIKSKLVFPSPSNPEKPIDIQSAWEKALERAYIENFRFHDLRHTAASYLAMNGASLTEIAEILGHKTFDMVKRYTHLSEAHTAKVVSSMNSKIFKELQTASCRMLPSVPIHTGDHNKTN